MLRSSAAMGSRLLKSLVASSRPSILYLRPITSTALISPVLRHHLFFSDPSSQFTGDQFRNYARGRATKVDEDIDESVDDDDIDDGEFMDDDDDDDDDDDEDSDESFSDDSE